MRRHVLLAALIVGTALPGAAAPGAQAQLPTICVNTTADEVLDPSQCLPGETCTLRAAIERADNKQVIVTACFDPALVPDARPCPAGCRVLQAASPEHFDADRKLWTLVQMPNSPELAVRYGALRVDFGYLVEGWSGPADNHVAFDSDIGRRSSDPVPSHGFNVTGTDAVFRGFEVRGTYTIAAFLVKDGAANNQFGPGLVFAGLHEGVGILLQDRQTNANRIVGNWCGVTGDGQLRDPIRDDCIAIVRGASANVVGGTELADRNVLSGSLIGGGVAVESASTRDNVIQGNWMGVSPDGTATMSNTVGIRIVQGAVGTRMVGNVIAGNSIGGIALFSPGDGTVIEDNVIGRLPGEEACGARAGNGAVGITVGGEAFDVRIARNVIHCNEGAGVAIRDPSVSGVHITENSIARNRGRAIVLEAGANGGVGRPQITVADASHAEGTSCPRCVVELFTDPAGQAQHYEGRTTASSSGAFTFDMPGGQRFSFNNLRGTSTEGRSTSELSDPRIVPAARTPSPTPYYQTATPTAPFARTPTPTSSPPPTETTVPATAPLALPWLGRRATR